MLYAPIDVTGLRKCFFFPSTDVKQNRDVPVCMRQMLVLTPVYTKVLHSNSFLGISIVLAAKYTVYIYVQFTPAAAK